MDFLKYKEKIEQLLKPKSFDIAELYFVETYRKSVELIDDRIETVKSGRDRGISLRIKKGNQLGFASSSNLTDEGLKNLVESAIFSMENTGEYEYNALLIFDEHNDVVRYDVEYDRAIKDISKDFLIDTVRSIVQYARDFSPKIELIRSVSAGIAYRDVFWGMCFGGVKTYSLANVFGSAELVAVDGDEKQIGYYSDTKRFLNEFSPQDIGKNAAYLAVYKLGSSPIKTGRYNVIFDDDIASELVSSLLPAFYGTNVFKRKSLFFNDYGKAIAPSYLSIKSYGGDKVGFYYPFDDEGIDVRSFPIVDKGTLVGFLHNLESAKALRFEPTGNGFRGGYSSAVSVSPVNVVLETTQDRLVDKENVYKYFKEAILVKEGMGLHTINPISGDFSFGINGVLIKDGEEVQSVRGITISGNLRELLGSIVAVSKDFRFYPYGVAGRKILVENMSIGGTS